MKINTAFVCVLTLISPGLLDAWQPDDWIYSTWPYAYESQSGDWYFILESGTQWLYSYASTDEGWHRLEESPLTEGWCWYSWPTVHGPTTNQWHLLIQTDTQWAVNLTTEEWSQYGHATERLTPEIEMVFVEGGTLSTSSYLDGLEVEPFYIGNCEVTWGEWKTVRSQASARGYDIENAGEGCADDHPVHSVNWYEAAKWCNLKSEIEGLEPMYLYNGEPLREGEPDNRYVGWVYSGYGYRLPQETEWEFAATGGSLSNAYTYAGSNDIDAVGWYFGNSDGAACDLYQGRGTWPVGQKMPNELGLYDMTGNVVEWCTDSNGYWGFERRLKGSSWASYPGNSTVLQDTPNNRSPRNGNNQIGFRLARKSGT